MSASRRTSSVSPSRSSSAEPSSWRTVLGRIDAMSSMLLEGSVAFWLVRLRTTWRVKIGACW